MHFRLQLWCIMNPFSLRNFMLQYGHITVGCGGHMTFGAGAGAGGNLREERVATRSFFTVCSCSFRIGRGILSASTRLVSATHALETLSFIFEVFLDASIRFIHSAFLDSVIASMVKYLRQLGLKQLRIFKDFRVLPRDRWQGSSCVYTVWLLSQAQRSASFFFHVFCR